MNSVSESGQPLSPQLGLQSLEELSHRQKNRLTDNLERADYRQNSIRKWVGRTMLGSAVGLGIAFISGELDHANFTHEMPYISEAQQVVDGIDKVLEVAGELAVPAALLTIGAVKLGANRDGRLLAIDSWSSREMNTDSKSGRDKPFRNILESTVAGKVPAMAAIGAGLAVFSTAISTEVSDGPQRPIATAFNQLTPGRSMIVGYAGAMPMVESNISRPLATAIETEANRRGIAAHELDLNLGQLTVGHSTLSDLAMGITVTPNSPISWRPVDGCNQLPIVIDRSANVKIGREVAVNGTLARVVGIYKEISATNRIGLVMDEHAMAACLKKDVNAPLHAVVLDTDPNTATEILQTTNGAHEAATVITKQHYLENSKDFWVSNVKPITNVLALFSGLFAFTAMGAAMRERLLRNRREWAAKSAAGVSDAMIRGTEMLRATKDGVIASIAGGIGAFATPFVVNSLESGFKAGVGFKEVMVGCAVGILGSVGGALRSLIRPQEIIDTKENTRV